MKTGVILSLGFAMLLSGVLAPLVQSDEVKIDQNEKQMKATIEGENTDSGRKPNLLYRGAGGLAQGAYYAAKVPVDAVGRGGFCG